MISPKSTCFVLPLSVFKREKGKVQVDIIFTGDNCHAHSILSTFIKKSLPQTGVPARLIRHKSVCRVIVNRSALACMQNMITAFIVYFLHCTLNGKVISGKKWGGGAGPNLCHDFHLLLLSSNQQGLLPLYALCMICILPQYLSSTNHSLSLSGLLTLSFLITSNKSLLGSD